MLFDLQQIITCEESPVLVIDDLCVHFLAGIFRFIFCCMIAAAAQLFIMNFLFIYYTKAKQLKDYEDAVIAKRLEELDEDELQALQEEIDRDSF